MRTDFTQIPSNTNDVDMGSDIYHDRYSPIPPNGKICAITGLKHAYLYRLLRHGAAAKHVRVAYLREPSSSRGRVLFHVGDMLQWLDSQTRPNDDASSKTAKEQGGTSQ